MGSVSRPSRVRIIPLCLARTSKNSRYSAAFVDERNRWFHKIHKYRYVAEAEEGQKFQHETTEILGNGPPSVTCFHSAIPVRSLDPYGYKVAGWDTERQAPYLFSIAPGPAVPEAQKCKAGGGPDQVKLSACS
jgi:hypothetical protein